MKFAIKSLLALLLFNSLCYAKAILRFQPAIDVNASRLGDLISITNDKQHWSMLPLQSHPIAGEIITSDAIVNWMKHQVGNIDIIWHGKKNTLVQTLKSITGSALLEKAKTALASKLKPQYSEIEITPLSLLKDSDYSLDSFKADVTPSYPAPKRLCVWLINDKQRIPVWFKIKAYAMVFVANHDLGYDQPIQKTVFSIKKRDIAGLNALPVQSLPDNTWLKSSIKHGQILLTKQLKKAPLIIHGQVIKVSIQNNTITITMDALAVTDGYLGETITVKNTLTQQSFNAIVKSDHKAEVLS